MKKSSFSVNDLETRASELLEGGTFIALRKERGKTCALYELYGRYVEVIVKRKVVHAIDFIDDDTNRLALYVKKQMIRLFFSK